MKSSYKNTLSYKDIFSNICFIYEPKKIVEIGILEGYSLKTFVDNTSHECLIEAYDIFDKFNGNSANYNLLHKTFDQYKNVKINHGDFYNLKDTFDNNSIDILHIDIANNGDVYEYVFHNYIDKISKNGIIILEGGSSKRDEILWMKKYKKPKIVPVLNKYKETYKIHTIGDIPSITLIKK